MSEEVVRISDELFKELNQKLKENYGSFNDKQHFRIVWSEDEYEMRLTEFTPEGWQLLVPEYRQYPKYKQNLNVQERYILEKLTEVPAFQVKELGTPISYEPLYVFQTRSGIPLAPKWSALKFFVENLLEAGRTRGHYNPSMVSNAIREAESEEARQERIKELEFELFGNETETTDAMGYKEAIVVPQNYVKIGRAK